MAGSAERLPNGNTFICESSSGRVFEVTSDCEVVWEYINPFLAISCYSDLLASGTVQSSATGPKSISDNENGQTDVNQSSLGISIRQNEKAATTFKVELI